MENVSHKFTWKVLSTAPSHFQNKPRLNYTGEITDPNMFFPAFYYIHRPWIH